VVFFFIVMNFLREEKTNFGEDFVDKNQKGD
jgi:hypothetical protein